MASRGAAGGAACAGHAAPDFELHGFSSIETRAVETVGQLLRKGEIDKEVYGLSRLQDDEGDRIRKAGKADPHALALHFDLTVPFARYVVENAGYLAFPFRRYQIQKVWRGERPQEGRAREFTQADIDVVGDGELPFRYDVEIALVIAEALSALPIPDFLLAHQQPQAGRGLLPRHRPGRHRRGAAQHRQAGEDRPGQGRRAAQGRARRHRRAGAAALKLAAIRTEDTSFVEQVRALGVSNELLEEGLNELEQVIAAAVQRAPGKVVADLSIARGLDYYTGTVVETVLVGHEQLGSICSGGRYDALASKGNRKFPGVGLSIGVTRLVSRILSQDLAKASRSVPTAVLVALTNDDSWGAAQDVAAQLRGRGIATEVAAKAEKFGKQIKFADRRGIPFVWFTDDDGKHQVKDIRSGEQVDADPASWTPPAEDLHVRRS